MLYTSTQDFLFGNGFHFNGEYFSRGEETIAVEELGKRPLSYFQEKYTYVPKKETPIEYSFPYGGLLLADQSQECTITSRLIHYPDFYCMAADNWDTEKQKKALDSLPASSRPSMTGIEKIAFISLYGLHAFIIFEAASTTGN